MTLEELFEAHGHLVYFVYNKHFNSSKNLTYKDDLMQEGRLALWEACSMFDENKEIKFSTFAVTVIYHKMLEALLKLSKHDKNLSLNTVVLRGKEGDSYTLEECLPAKEEYSIIDLKIILQGCLETLSARDKQIILLICKGYKQDQIAKSVKLSQAQVSRILKQFKLKIQNQLKEN